MHSPSPRRERQLVMGGPGVGKTRAYLTIAELARKTRSEARFYVIDTDYTLDASLEEFPKLAKWGNFIWEQVSTFDDQLELARQYKKKANRGDWMVTDMVSTIWESVQDDHSEKVYGMNKADYFLMKRQEIEEQMRAKKNFQPYEGWLDWPTIKARHADFINTAIINNDAHIFACAESRPLNRSTDDKRVVETFEHIGARPGGEKRLGHLFHTVLLMRQRDEDEWTVETGKDRARKQGKHVLTPKASYAKVYLLGVAGWKLS